MSDGSRALPASLPEWAARRERAVVIVAVTVIAAAGLYLTLETGDVLMATPEGDGIYLPLLFVMWWTMMMAMMLPSAAPAILLYGTMNRKLAERGTSIAPVAVFALGYAAIWTVFSAAAMALQLASARLVPLTGMMAVTSAAAGAVLLVAAGLYQLSPLKNACLRKCRTPLMFFAHRWRKGALGAFAMGIEHGIVCLGCCWVLMGLLFYGGVMEPVWIIGLAAYVGLEKLAPGGGLISRLSGVLLVAWGGISLIAAMT